MILAAFAVHSLSLLSLSLSQRGERILSIIRPRFRCNVFRAPCGFQFAQSLHRSDRLVAV